MNNFIRKKFCFIKKKSMAVLLLLIVALIFTSCASGSKTSAPAAQENYSFSESVAYDSSYPEAPQAAAPAENGYGGSGLGESDYKEKVSADNIMSQRKIIMEGDVSLETLDFDDSINAMDQLIKDFGGFAEAKM